MKLVFQNFLFCVCYRKAAEAAAKAAAAAVNAQMAAQQQIEVNAANGMGSNTLVIEVQPGGSFELAGMWDTGQQEQQLLVPTSADNLKNFVMVLQSSGLVANSLV